MSSSLLDLKTKCYMVRLQISEAVLQMYRKVDTDCANLE